MKILLKKSILKNTKLHFLQYFVRFEILKDKNMNFMLWISVSYPPGEPREPGERRELEEEQFSRDSQSCDLIFILL